MAVTMVYIDNGKYGHPDLKRAWDIFKRECNNAGKPVPRVMQAAGNAKASADTHKDGMAIDWDSTDPWYATLWRKVTSGPAWPRLWPGNHHTHGVLPNSGSAAYQVRAYRARRDGLGWQGLKGGDTLPYYPPMALDKALSRWEERTPVTCKGIYAMGLDDKGNRRPIDYTTTMAGNRGNWAIIQKILGAQKNPRTGKGYYDLTRYKADGVYGKVTQEALDEYRITTYKTTNPAVVRGKMGWTTFHKLTSWAGWAPRR